MALAEQLPPQRYPVLPYEVLDNFAGFDHLSTERWVAGRPVFIAAGLHSPDPEHPIYANMHDAFDRFLAVSEPQDRTLLVEGGIWSVAANEPAAIEQGGESALLTYWGQQHDAQVDTWEPTPRHSEMNDLAKTFTRDQVMLYCLMRQLPQAASLSPEQGQTSEEYLQTMLDGYRNHLVALDPEWEAYDFSYEHLLAQYEMFAGRPLDLKDMDFFYDQAMSPSKTLTIIQQVSRACNGARSQSFARKVDTLSAAGRAVFATLGTAHFLVLEPFIEQLGTATPPNHFRKILGEMAVAF